MAGLTIGTAEGIVLSAWGIDGTMTSETPRTPRIPATIANWLLALVLAVPLAFMWRTIRIDYGYWPPFDIRRPLELLGFWLLCYWGVMAVRFLWANR